MGLIARTGARAGEEGAFALLLFLPGEAARRRLRWCPDGRRYLRRPASPSGRSCAVTELCSEEDACPPASPCPDARRRAGCCNATSLGRAEIDVWLQAG